MVDDEDILRTVAMSGARALFIGRRALVALGLPVLTSDYDLWIHIDDIEKLNVAFHALDFVPTHSPDESRRRGRYVLEDGEHVDVMVAKGKSAPDGRSLTFEDAWARRSAVPIDDALTVYVPSIDDLILTKLWGSRPKDLQDIESLEALKRRR